MHSNQVDGLADHFSAAVSSQYKQVPTGHAQFELARSGALDVNGERNRAHTLLQNDQTISFKRGSFVENSASGSYGIPPTSQKKVESETALQDQIGVNSSMRPFQQTHQWSETPQISTAGADESAGQTLHMHPGSMQQPSNFTLPAGHASLMAGRNDSAAILGALDTFNQRSQSLRQRMQKFNDRLFETDKILMLQGLATRSKGTEAAKQPGQEDAYGQVNASQERVSIHRQPNATQDPVVIRQYQTDYSSQVTHNRKLAHEASSPVNGDQMNVSEKEAKQESDISSSEADLDDDKHCGGIAMGLPQEILEQLQSQQQMAQQAGVDVIGSYRQLRMYTSQSPEIDDEEWPEEATQRPGVLLQHPTKNQGYVTRQQNYHATQTNSQMFVVAPVLTEVIQENSLEISAMSNSKNNSGALLNGRTGCPITYPASGGFTGVMSSGQARSHNSNTDGILTIGNNTNDYRSGTANGNCADRLGYSTSIQNGRLISTNNMNEDEEEELDSSSLRPIEEQLALSDASKGVCGRRGDTGTMSQNMMHCLNQNSNTGSAENLAISLPLSSMPEVMPAPRQPLTRDQMKVSMSAVTPSMLTTNNNSRKSVLLDIKRMDASSGNHSRLSHDQMARLAGVSESAATPAEHAQSYRPVSNAMGGDSTYEASASQSRHYGSSKPGTVSSSRAILMTRNQTMLQSRQENQMRPYENGLRDRSTVSNGTNDLTNRGKSEPICSDIETQRMQTAPPQICDDSNRYHQDHEAPEHQRQQTSCFPAPNKSNFENTLNNDINEVHNSMRRSVTGASQQNLGIKRGDHHEYEKMQSMRAHLQVDQRHARSSDQKKRVESAQSHANLFRVQMSTSFSNLPHRLDATNGSSKRKFKSQQRNPCTGNTTEKNSQYIMNQIKLQNERARSSEPGNYSSQGMPSPQQHQSTKQENSRLFQKLGSVQNIHEQQQQFQGKNEQHNNSTQVWSMQQAEAVQGIPDQIHDERLQAISQERKRIIEEANAEAVDGAISDSQKTFNKLQRLLTKNETECVNTGELPAEWLQALSQQHASSGTQEQIMRSLQKFKTVKGGIVNLTSDGTTGRPRMDRDHFDPWAASAGAKAMRQNDPRTGLRNYFIQSSLTFNGGEGATGSSSMGHKVPAKSSLEHESSANEIEIWDGERQTDARRVAPLQESIIMHSKDEEDGYNYLELQRQSMQTDLQNPVVMVEQQMAQSFTELPDDIKKSKQQFIISSNGRYKQQAVMGQPPPPVKYHTRTNSYSQKMTQLINSTSTQPLKQQVGSSNSKMNENSHSQQLTQSQSASNHALQAVALQSSHAVSTVDDRLIGAGPHLIVHRDSAIHANESGLLPTQLLSSTHDAPQSVAPHSHLHDQFVTGDQTLAEALNAGGVRLSDQQAFDAEDHTELSGVQLAFESHADHGKAFKVSMLEAQRDSLGRSTAAVGTFSNSQSRYAGQQVDASSIMPMRESVDSILLPMSTNVRKSQHLSSYEQNTSQNDMLMNSALEPQTIFDLPDALLRVQALTQQVNELQMGITEAYDSRDRTHAKLMTALQSKKKLEDDSVQLQEKQLRLETQILDLVEEKRLLRTQLDQLKLSMIDMAQASDRSQNEKENVNGENLPAAEHTMPIHHYDVNEAANDELQQHLFKLQAENQTYYENQQALEQQLVLMQEMLRERNAQLGRLAEQAQSNLDSNVSHAVEELRHKLELKERELDAVVAEKAERDKWLAAQYQHIGILTQQVERAWTMIAGTVPNGAASSVDRQHNGSSMMSSQADNNGMADLGGESCIQAINEAESSRPQDSSIVEQNHFVDFNEHNGSFGGCVPQQNDLEPRSEEEVETDSPEPADMTNSRHLRHELKNIHQMNYDMPQQHSASVEPQLPLQPPVMQRHAQSQTKKQLQCSPHKLQYEPPIIQNISVSPVTKEVAKLRQLFTNLTEHMAQLVQQRQQDPPKPYQAPQPVIVQQQPSHDDMQVRHAASQLSNDLQDLTRQLKSVFSVQQQQQIQQPQVPQPTTIREMHHHSHSSMSHQESLFQQERLLAQERVNTELRSENSRLQSKLGQVREQLASVEVRLAFLQEQSRLDASRQEEARRADTSMSNVKLYEDEVTRLRDQVLQARIDQQRTLLQAKQAKLELADRYQGQLKTMRGCLGFVLGKSGLKQDQVPHFLKEKLQLELSSLDLSQELHSALRRYQQKIQSFKDYRAAAELKLHEARNNCLELQHILDQERKLKRNLLNQMQDLRGSVRVFCRIRPQLRHEAHRGFRPMMYSVQNQNKLVISGATRKNYHFDRIFDGSSSQDQVFDELQCLVQSAMNGSNVCIMSYGQTGSGKTYTMVGDDRNPGLYFSTVDEIYRLLRHEQARQSSEEAVSSPRFELSCSIVEIYNEQIRDLLQKNQQNNAVRLLEENGRVHAIQTRRAIQSKNHLLKAMRDAFYNRTVGVTQFNEYSSRSHFVVTVYIRHWTTSGHCRQGQLTLVDLAGSERILQTEASGIRIKEAQNINKSLATLGKVFLHLKKKSSHVPYRDSKLTHYLKDAIGGETSKTVVIVQMSPLEKDRNESLGTLAFGQKAQQIEKRSNSVPAMKRSFAPDYESVSRPVEKRGRITQDKSKKRLRTSRSYVSYGSNKKSTCSKHRNSQMAKPLLGRSSEFLPSSKNVPKGNLRHKRVASVKTHRVAVRSQSGTGKVARRMRSYSESIFESNQTARKPREAYGSIKKQRLHGSKELRSRKEDSQVQYSSTRKRGQSRKSAGQKQVNQKQTSRPPQKKLEDKSMLHGSTGKHSILRLTPSAQRKESTARVSQQMTQRPLRLQDLASHGGSKQRNESLKKTARAHQPLPVREQQYFTKIRKTTEPRDELSIIEPIMASSQVQYGGFNDSAAQVPPLVQSTSLLSKSPAYDCKYYQLNASGSVTTSVAASPLSRTNPLIAHDDPRRIVKLDMKNKIFEVPQESEEEVTGSKEVIKSVINQSHRIAQPKSNILLEVEAQQPVKQKATTSRPDFDSCTPVDGGHSDTSTRSGAVKTEHNQTWLIQPKSDNGGEVKINVNSVRMQPTIQSLKPVTQQPSMHVLGLTRPGSRSRRGQDLAAVDSTVIFSSHEGPSVGHFRSKDMHNASIVDSSQGLSSFYRGHQHQFENDASVAHKKREVFEHLSFDRPQENHTADSLRQDLQMNSRKSLTRRVSPHHLQASRLASVIGPASNSELHSTRGRLMQSNYASEMMPQYTTTDGGRDFVGSVNKMINSGLGNGIQGNAIAASGAQSTAINRDTRLSIPHAQKMDQYRNLRNELSHRDDKSQRVEILVVEDGVRERSGANQTYLSSGFKSNYAASYHANGGACSSQGHDETMGAEERRARQCRLLDELQEVNRKLQDLDQKLIHQGRRVEERHAHK